MGYLAQHPLFDQIPELAHDIREPEYCTLGEGGLHSVNAWFGPAGTVSLPGADCSRVRLCNCKVGRKLHEQAEVSGYCPTHCANHPQHGCDGLQAHG